MKKIPSLFKRDYGSKKRLVYDEVVPGCEWVLEGKGVPYAKLDGTSCTFIGGRLYKRYDRKQGKAELPDGWIAAEEAPNGHTGHWPGWVPVNPGEPANQWHIEGLDEIVGGVINGDTYELVGPKVQGNPHNFDKHMLIHHRSWPLSEDAGRNFVDIRQFLEETELIIEGVVWWHINGRMAKIKRRDFGLPWPIKQVSP